MPPRYEDPKTGEWIPDFFEAFLEGVIAASTGGKTVILHFSPGPAFPPIIHYPKRPSPPYNSFLALDWPVSPPTQYRSLNPILRGAYQ